MKALKKKKKENLCNPFMLPATWAIRFSLAAAISPQVFSLASQRKRLQLPHMPRGVTSKIIIHFIVFYSCAKNMAIFYEPWFDLKLLCFEQSCQSYLRLTQAFPKTSWNKIKIILSAIHVYIVSWKANFQILQKWEKTLFHEILF